MASIEITAHDLVVRLHGLDKILANAEQRVRPAGARGRHSRARRGGQLQATRRKVLLRLARSAQGDRHRSPASSRAPEHSDEATIRILHESYETPAWKSALAIATGIALAPVAAIASSFSPPHWLRFSYWGS